MGPKGKSKNEFAQRKGAAQVAQLAAKLSNMQGKLDTLNSEIEILLSQYEQKVLELKEHKVNFDLLVEHNYQLCSDIAEQRQIIDDNSSILQNLLKQANKQDKRISYKRNKYSINSSVDLQYSSLKPAKFSISDEIAKKRKLNPYSDDISSRCRKRRCTEFFSAASFIAGGSMTNKIPVLECLLDTISHNFKSIDVVTRLSSSKATHIQKLNNNCIMSWHNSFYKSEENKIRSLSVFYSHNVMGKQKYLSLRKANSNSGYYQQKIANYILYTELSIFIRSIDIGVVHPITELTVVKDNVQGCYRQIQSYVLRLAKFYLNVNQYRKDKLMEFDYTKKNSDSFLFLLSFGGDGAPGVGTVFDISFINVGCRILSSSETFMVFGADVDETSDIVKLF